MGTIRQKVALQEIRFFAYHGFYPQEQKIGNEFLLDIETEMDVTGKGDEDISLTVNYERLFEIAREEMEKPRRLLETVAYSILEKIRMEFLSVKTVRIALRKLNPPVPGEVKNSLVELNFNR
ncbi:MAG TPA: dihydroneopterin aldolase [Sphingobacteriaceae bacterium]